MSWPITSTPLFSFFSLLFSTMTCLQSHDRVLQFPFPLLSLSLSWSLSWSHDRAIQLPLLASLITVRLSYLSQLVLTYTPCLPLTHTEPLKTRSNFISHAQSTVVQPYCGTVHSRLPIVLVPISILQCATLLWCSYWLIMTLVLRIPSRGLTAVAQPIVVVYKPSCSGA